MAVLERVASTSGSLTLTNAPTVDEFVIVTLGYRGTIPASPSSVSGGGATWTKLYDHLIGPSTYNQDVEVWVGTNFTGAGPITCTAYGTVYMTAFHLDGGNVDDIEVGVDPGFVNGDGGSINTGPNTVAGPGDVVIGHIGCRWTYPATVPEVLTPASGWSTVSVSPEIGGWQKFWTLYREPEISETHKLQVPSANTPSSVLQILVPAASAPEIGPLYMDKVLAKDPYLAYGLDETVGQFQDASGNGRHVDHQAGVRGVSGVSLNPEGLGVRDLQLQVIPIPTAMPEFTYETLFVPESFPSGIHFFAARDDNAGSDVWQFRMDTDSCQFVVKDTTGGYVSAVIYGMEVGTRYHLACRVTDSDIKLDVYDLDVGYLLGSAITPIPNGIRTNITPSLKIGWAPWRSAQVRGVVDNIALYDRALSNEELYENRLAANELLVEVPNPPVDLFVENISDTGADFRWNESLEGEAPVRFEYSLDDGAIQDNGLIKQVSITGLAPDATYTFRVRTVGSTSSSTWKEETFTTTVGAPVPPTNVALSQITNNSATATWQWSQNGGPEALGYELQLIGYNISWLAAPETSWNLMGLQSNTDYTFQVRSVGEFGKSEWVAAPLRTLGPPTESVTNLLVSNIGGTTATAQWTKATAATGYHYRIDGGDYVILGDVATIALAALPPEAEITLEVRGFNQYGSSAWTSVVFTTLRAAPNAPQGLRISSSTSTMITATWQPPSSGSEATSYQYSLDNGPWVEVLAGNTSVTIEGFAPGSSHNIRVRSKNSVGTSSGFDSLDFQMILGPPNTPQELMVYQITQSQATIKWATSVSGPPVVRYEYSFDMSAVTNAGLVQTVFIENLEAGSNHNFRVRAVGEYGVSSWADVDFSTEESDVPIPDTLRLEWNKSGMKEYENGIDRGVLYLSNSLGVAWNGLVGLEEDLGDEGTEPLYFDGEKYLDSMTMGDFSGGLRAVTYPDEFLAYEGFGEIGLGVYADDQTADIFGLSFRTMIGNDTLGDEYGYRIHIVYNLTAVPESRSRATIGSNASLTEFGWALSAVPVHVRNHRPTAHVMLDSRHMNEYILRGIEEILYGSEKGAARLPTIDELMDFIENFQFIQIFDNGDGTWTARGPDELIQMLDPTTFVISEANASYVDNDTYTISDS